MITCLTLTWFITPVPLGMCWCWTVGVDGVGVVVGVGVNVGVGVGHGWWVITCLPSPAFTTPVLLGWSV